MEFGMNLIALRKCSKDEYRSVSKIVSVKDRVDVASVIHYWKKARETNPTKE